MCQGRGQLSGVSSLLSPRVLGIKLSHQVCLASAFTCGAVWMALSDSFKWFYRLTCVNSMSWCIRIQLRVWRGPAESLMWQESGYTSWALSLLNSRPTLKLIQCDFFTLFFKGKWVMAVIKSSNQGFSQWLIFFKAATVFPSPSSFLFMWGWLPGFSEINT